MSQIIITKIKSILSEALTRFAAKDINGIPQTSNVKIIISALDDENCPPAYRVMVGDKFLRKEDGDFSNIAGYEDYWTLLELMDKRIDFMGYETHAGNYLPKGFKEKAQELSEKQNVHVRPTEVNIMAWTDRNEKEPDPLLALYHRYTWVRQLTFEQDIFKTQLA